VHSANFVSRNLLSRSRSIVVFNRMSDFSTPGGSPLKPSKRSDEFYLSIRKQPPTHVFCDEEFQVEFALECKSPQHSPPNDITVQARLEPVQQPSSSSPAQSAASVELNLLEEPRLSASRKTGKLVCSLSGGVVARERGCVHKIIISAQHEKVLPVATDNVHMVNAKIRVTTGDEWSNVWYKDEGGRDKSMEIHVAMYNRENSLLKERVPLSLTLFYASQPPLIVTNQDILRTLGSDRKLCIDKFSGSTRIRFRIEDVSKNHQGQDFQLEIAADNKTIKDVAPGYTPAVSVRSKRNKRQRSSLGTATASMPSSDQHATPIAQQPAHASMEPSRYWDSSGVDAESLREAIHGVSQWAGEVVNGLYPLQWQVVGYAQHPDGSPDYNRPYHSMSNPNPLISRVLAIYSDTTRSQLQLLEQTITRNPASVVTTSKRAGDSVAAAPSNTTPSYRVNPGMSSFPPSQPEEHYAMMTAPSAASRPVMTLPPPPPVGESAYREYSTFYGRPPTRFDETHDPLRMPHPPLSQLKSPPKSTTPAVSRAAMHSTAVAARRSSSPEHDETRESEVEYVLAKQYKSTRTGERLGFPAYSANKEILGFYSESASKVSAGQFIPIDRHADDFGNPHVMQQATAILQQAIDSKSEAVHSLRDWGSISNLIDHALVYDWSKNIASGSSGGSNRTESED